MRRSSGSSPDKTKTVICRECKREILDNYQTIQTQRKTTVYICNECLKKIREEVQRARDSK